ncbi:cytochrome c oxidase subunit II [Pseudoxanthomonas suwonensis]|uniref:Cytochrome C oxidase subunit II n=1 Tax=Pseudoxanthomonas suwonensis TaxID=314722 RepID=A0A0E3YYP1_9GAMM|nr:cytochrome C oxidase subunit II [Pseudoxanthomonas suwonensis]AKC85432.1 cytochrome C oxidase subunit II [Pseudoxanthomonas suwonensis]
MLLAILLAACRGPQSALDPAGPAAEAIAGTWWLMFWGACAVWLLVVALVLAGMRRERGLSAAGARRMIVGGGLVLPTVLLAALLVHGTLSSDRITGRSAEVEHVVAVTARQWQWEFVHLDRDGTPLAVTTDVLAMPLGAMVEFRIDSADVIHSFWIPRLGGKIDAIPGRTNVLRLRADRAGPIRGQCAEFCGLEHAIMAFDVRVLEADDYAAWMRTHAVGVAAAEAAP